MAQAWRGHGAGTRRHGQGGTRRGVACFRLAWRGMLAIVVAWRRRSTRTIAADNARGLVGRPVGDGPRRSHPAVAGYVRVGGRGENAADVVVPNLQ